MGAWDSAVDKVGSIIFGGKEPTAKIIELSGKEEQSEREQLLMRSLSHMEGVAAALQAQITAMQKMQESQTIYDIAERLSLEAKKQREAKEKGYVSYTDVANRIRQGLIHVFYRENVYCGKALDIAHFNDVTTGRDAVVLIVLDENGNKKEFIGKDLHDLFANPKYLGMHLKQGNLTLKHSFSTGQKIPEMPELLSEDGVNTAPADQLLHSEKIKRQEAEAKEFEAKALSESEREKREKIESEKQYLLRQLEEKKKEIDHLRQQALDYSQSMSDATKQLSQAEIGRELYKAANELIEPAAIKLMEKNVELQTGMPLSVALNAIREAQKLTRSAPPAKELPSSASQEETEQP